MKVTELKIKENIDKLFYMNQIQEEKVEMVDQERSTFLQRIENLGHELRRYKQELLAVKDQLHQEMENSHLILKASMSDFNLKVEQIESEMALEK